MLCSLVYLNDSCSIYRLYFPSGCSFEGSFYSNKKHFWQKFTIAMASFNLLITFYEFYKLITEQCDFDENILLLK